MVSILLYQNNENSNSIVYVIYYDQKGDTYEGKLDKTLSEKPVQVLQENEI